MRNIRVHIVLISCVVVLLGGLLARGYLHSTRVIEPLREAVEAVPGVAEVNLVPGEQVVKIALHQSAYLSEIVPLVQKSLAAFGGQFTLELMDEPTAEQRDALRRMMFVVEEAILQGSFQDMEALLQEMAQEYGQELTLAVDRSYVYIQLRDGEGHLNRVIGRGGTELGVSS